MTGTQLPEFISLVLYFLAWLVGFAILCLLSMMVYDWKVDREERERLLKIRREMNRRVD